MSIGRITGGGDQEWAVEVKVNKSKSVNRDYLVESYLFSESCKQKFILLLKFQSFLSYNLRVTSIVFRDVLPYRKVAVLFLLAYEKFILYKG